MHLMDDQTPVPRLRTDRLLLREWRRGDLEPFAQLNADPAVAELLAGPLPREESDALAGRIVAGWRERGYGLWAVERIEEGMFLGFTGLSLPRWAPEPSVEIGWRLARHAWGHGYATEAARTAVRFAFEDLALDALVSYTAVTNARSRRAMDRNRSTSCIRDCPRVILSASTSPTACRAPSGWRASADLGTSIWARACTWTEYMTILGRVRSRLWSWTSPRCCARCAGPMATSSR